MAISLTSTNTSGAVNVNGVDVLTTDAGGNVSLRTGGVNQSIATLPTIKQGVAVTTTGASAFDFTGIPTGVKRITVMFNGVSVSGTSSIQIQLGTSGGIVTTGYSSCSSQVYPTTGNTSTSTTGLHFFNNNGGMVLSGTLTVTNFNANTWVSNGTIASPVAGVATQHCISTAGSVSIPSILDRLRLTTVNGTDTFDAGSVNITWEF